VNLSRYNSKVVDRRNSEVKSKGTSRILNSVSVDWASKYKQIRFTNEWITSNGEVVLFGSLKSDLRQGVAIYSEELNGISTKKYLTPSRHGAITAQTLLASASAVQVKASDGHAWIFNLNGLGFAEKTKGGRYAGKWSQLDRLRYVEGSVVSVNQDSDGTAILKLEIVKNFHNGADPMGGAGDPYKIGSVQKFVLQRLPGISLKAGEDIVIYQCGVYPLSGSMNQFLGAAIRYYKKSGAYYDLSGEKVTMPPKEYPEFYDIFK
jgi:hypothetical protein